MSAAVSLHNNGYSYERTIFDGKYIGGKKHYFADDALRDLHHARREQMIAAGVIRPHVEPECLMMTDDDKIIADKHIDYGDWTWGLDEHLLPNFEQTDGYEEVAGLMWGHLRDE